jgi:hypothetical protein
MVLASAGAWGQGAPAAQPTKPAEPPAKAPGPGEGLPSLDELLGTTEEAGKESGAKPARETVGLKEKLSPEELRDEFEQAVRLMGDTAARLEQRGDTGLETQRLQEDILRKLRKIVEEAKRQQQQQQQQQRQQQQQQQQQNQSPQNQSRPQSREQQSQEQAGDPDRAQERPGERGGNPGQALSGPSTWGDLPPHVREALTQGLGDRFSAMYRRMTEEYYRRLAEEPRK